MNTVKSRIDAAQRRLRQECEDSLLSVNLRTCPGVPHWSCSRRQGHEGPCALTPSPITGRMSSTESNMPPIQEVPSSLKGTSVWAGTLPYAIVIDSQTDVWRLMERNVLQQMVEQQENNMDPRADVKSNPTTTGFPILVDNRGVANALVSYDDIPRGAFVEHAASRRVGMRTDKGIAWIPGIRLAAGGLVESYTMRSDTPQFYILHNVTITINNR